jgi:predicted metal-dependent HD superfamily phosphohydrolase
MPNLSERFLNLWDKLDVIGDLEVPYADLVSRYAERSRSYHTLAHIEALLAEFDLFRESKEKELEAKFFCAEAIEMAIWYHDAVYNTQAKDNEEKSAALFRVVAESASLTGIFPEKVVGAILATKHLVAPSDFDSAVVCDVDLAIFGQPEWTFDEYERQIRREYGWVSEIQFREGRRAILQSFLQRPTIYSTKFFRGKYEAQARENLARSIERLNPPE